MPSGRDDTIVAVITPPGEGGIAGIRLAGPNSRELARRHLRFDTTESDLKPFVMRHAWFITASGAALDEVMAVGMPAGRSYTGLEQVELYCHGGRRVVQRIIDELTASGARAAEPGEFTRLAFLSGRIDLARAEAVAEIISAATDSSLQAARDHLSGAYSQHIESLRTRLIDMAATVEAAIDYPEEDLPPLEKARLDSEMVDISKTIKDLKQSYRGGRIIREGFRVALCGRPNAGKSSLFNLLLRQQRALVTPEPGTTRDYLSEWIDLDGYAVNLIDTAGLRAGGGTIERAGQESTREIMGRSDLVLWLVDVSVRDWSKVLDRDRRELADKPHLLVLNKIDVRSRVESAADMAGRDDADWVAISCRTRRGIKELVQAICGRIRRLTPDLTSGAVVTSARHHQKLGAALTSLGAARRLWRTGESPEVVAFELRRALSQLDEITGKIYSEDILDRIFSAFCIGK